MRNARQVRVVEADLQRLLIVLFDGLANSSAGRCLVCGAAETMKLHRRTVVAVELRIAQKQREFLVAAFHQSAEAGNVAAKTLQNTLQQRG